MLVNVNIKDHIQAGTACYNGITFNLGNDLPTGCAFHRGAGTNVANAWFVGGQSPSHHIILVLVLLCQVVLPASFSHIDVLELVVV